MYRVISTKREPNKTYQKLFSTFVEAVQYKGQLEATGKYCFAAVEKIENNIIKNIIEELMKKYEELTDLERMLIGHAVHASEDVSYKEAETSTRYISIWFDLPEEIVTECYIEYTDRLLEDEFPKRRKQ